MSAKRRLSVQYDEDLKKKLWANLEQVLWNHAYWNTSTPATWSITAYDKSLLRKSYNNKRMAHAKLNEDLNAISITFPKQTEIQRNIKLLRDSLAKCNRDQENQTFWATIAIDLNKAVQEREVATARLTNSAMNYSSSILDKEVCSDKDHVIFSPNCQPSSSRDKEKSILQEHPIPDPESSMSEVSDELDANELPNSKSSAAIIKYKAEEIYKKFLNGVDITVHERKIMTNGLSSILDLSDNSFYSQQLFFTADRWKSMNDLYQEKYHIPLVKFPAAVSSTWKIVCHKLKTTRNIDSGLKYLYQIYPKYFDDKAVFTPLKAFEMVLTAMNNQNYLLEKQTKIDVTEYDYLGNIWLPLFRVLFEKSNIRIKTHESTFSYTTQRKIDQYPKSTNVIGFKIDIRFLVDRYDQEYDLCSGEMAKMDDHDKIMGDKAKVNRESKDDLDCVLDLCEESEWTDRIAWQFQSTGSTGCLNSIHLVGNGLYVVLGRYEMKFPSSIANIPDLLPLMNDLFTWRESMYEASDFIMSKVTERHRMGLENYITSPTPHRILQRDTTYTPPEKTTKWRMPPSLYGYVPTNITEKLLEAFHSSSSASSSAPGPSSAQAESSFATHENLVYDSNGWAWTGVKWYNSILHEYWDDSPYGDNM